MIIYYSYALGSLPFGYILIEPYTFFDHDYHNYNFFKYNRIIKNVMFKLSMTRLLSYCPLVYVFKFAI